MRELTTTVLDVLGLLLVAAGAAAAAWVLVGPAALLVAGVVVLAGSWFAARARPTAAQADVLGVEAPRPTLPNPGMPERSPIALRGRRQR